MSVWWRCWPGCAFPQTTAARAHIKKDEANRQQSMNAFAMRGLGVFTSQLDKPLRLIVLGRFFNHVVLGVRRFSFKIEYSNAFSLCCARVCTLGVRGVRGVRDVCARN